MIWQHFNLVKLCLMIGCGKGLSTIWRWVPAVPMWSAPGILQKSLVFTRSAWGKFWYKMLLEPCGATCPKTFLRSFWVAWQLMQDGRATALPRLCSGMSSNGRCEPQQKSRRDLSSFMPFQNRLKNSTSTTDLHAFRFQRRHWLLIW